MNSWAWLGDDKCFYEDNLSLVIASWVMFQCVKLIVHSLYNFPWHFPLVHAMLWTWGIFDVWLYFNINSCPYRVMSFFVRWWLEILFQCWVSVVNYMGVNFRSREIFSLMLQNSKCQHKVWDIYGGYQMNWGRILGWTISIKPCFFFHYEKLRKYNFSKLHIIMSIWTYCSTNNMHC